MYNVTCNCVAEVDSFKLPVLVDIVYVSPKTSETQTLFEYVSTLISSYASFYALLQSKMQFIMYAYVFYSQFCLSDLFCLGKDS